MDAPALYLFQHLYYIQCIKNIFYPTCTQANLMTYWSDLLPIVRLNNNTTTDRKNLIFIVILNFAFLVRFRMRKLIQNSFHFTNRCKFIDESPGVVARVHVCLHTLRLCTPVWRLVYTVSGFLVYHNVTAPAIRKSQPADVNNNGNNLCRYTNYHLLHTSTCKLEFVFDENTFIHELISMDVSCYRLNFFRKHRLSRYM